jgi:hypothetical protein
MSAKETDEQARARFAETYWPCDWCGRHFKMKELTVTEHAPSDLNLSRWSYWCNTHSPSPNYDLFLPFSLTMSKKTAMGGGYVK